MGKRRTRVKVVLCHSACMYCVTDSKYKTSNNNKIEKARHAQFWLADGRFLLIFDFVFFNHKTKRLHALSCGKLHLTLKCSSAHPTLLPQGRVPQGGAVPTSLA